MMRNSYRSSVISRQFWHNLWQVCFRLPLQSLLLKTVNRRLIALMLPFLLIAILFILANWCFPLPKARLHPPVSQIVLDRNGEWLRAFLADDGMWRIAVSSQQSAVSKERSVVEGDTQLPQVPESREPRAKSHFLHQAMLTSEDRWFYYHYGINPVSIATALYDNLKAGKVVRGGSTITMQVARLMEPKARNIPNKLIEMFRALQLEHAYSKSEILTFYFNMLPYGGNIVGTAAASRFYFNKPQHALSLGETALLAAIPNAPERLRPDRFPENVRKAREKVLNRLLARRQISEQQWQEAVQEPIPNKRYALPFKAPHLSRLLVKKNRSNAKLTSDGRIYTTIDAKVQETVVRILSEYLESERKLSLRGSHSTSTGAIIVMDTQSRHVLAMVGSHDFFDQEALGQVNGTLAPRSPGSALKPFVYALAMEQGLITPETLLFDVPVTYAGYEPVNYDGKYNGYITARQALARSLNVPAVNLNSRLENRTLYSPPIQESKARVGGSTLHTFLKQAGISTLAPAQKYGLSMVLGGCEVNLLELTTLYAGLANMGEFGHYQLTLPRNSHLPQRLLRKETSFIITEMLTDSQLPINTVKNPEAFERTMNLPKIAWKTGTSYGHRDAWCIGYSPTLTIGVWLGNFSGKGTPMLSGTEAATPILFALFTALTGQDTHRWFTKPEQLKTRQVCALSGAPVSPHCPVHKDDVYIPGISSVAACTIHKRIYVNKATGYSLCSHCRKNNLRFPSVSVSSQQNSNQQSAISNQQESVTSTESLLTEGFRRFPKVSESHSTTRTSLSETQAKIFEEWPADAATWLAENGFAVSVLPEHNPLCTGTIAGNAPVILSPTEDTIYYIREGIPLENQKIRLIASASSRTQDLFWFLDGELIFQGNAGEQYWLTPTKGKHVLTCVDAEGRSATRPLHISTF